MCLESVLFTHENNDGSLSKFYAEYKLRTVSQKNIVFMKTELKNVHGSDKLVFERTSIYQNFPFLIRLLEFTCRLFNDNVSKADDVASNNRIIYEL